MRTDSYDTGNPHGPDYTALEPGGQTTKASLLPFLALAPLGRDILANAAHLPDTDLMRVAGSLRSLADEVMAVVDRRLGARPAPRLVVDNTRR